MVWSIKWSKRTLKCMPKRCLGLPKSMWRKNCAHSNGRSHVIHLSKEIGHLLTLQVCFSNFLWIHYISIVLPPAHQNEWKSNWTCTIGSLRIIYFLKPGQNKKGQKIFQLHRFLNTFFSAGSWEIVLIQKTVKPFLFCDGFNINILFENMI